MFSETQCFQFSCGHHSLKDSLADLLLACLSLCLLRLGKRCTHYSRFSLAGGLDFFFWGKQVTKQTLNLTEFSCCCCGVWFIYLFIYLVYFLFVVVNVVEKSRFECFKIRLSCWEVFGFIAWKTWSDFYKLQWRGQTLGWCKAKFFTEFCRAFLALSPVSCLSYYNQSVKKNPNMFFVPPQLLYLLL